MNHNGGEHKTYKYDELPEAAKPRALEVIRERFWPDYGWWDCVYDSIENFCKTLKGDVVIGGSDCGRGGYIMWDSWLYLTDKNIDALEENFGERVAPIVEDMRAVLAIYKLGNHALGVDEPLWMQVANTRRGSEVAASLMDYVDANEGDENPLATHIHNMLVDIHDSISALFIDWLRDDYEYLTSDECMLETADCNGVMFDEEGVIVDD